MDSCEKYIELISAGIDGELSDEELSELIEHLKTCRECREYARMVKAASDAVKETAQEVPEGLTESVMATIRQTKKKRWTVGRISTLAAAVAVVVLASVALPNMPIGCGSAKTEECAEEVETSSAMPSESEVSEGSDTVVYDKEEFESESYIKDKENGKVFGQGQMIDGQSAPMPTIPFSEEFSAIAIWTDGDAQMLDSYEQESGAESEVYVFVPAKDMEELTQRFGMTVYTQGDNISSEAERALIVVY